MYAAQLSLHLTKSYTYPRVLTANIQYMCIGLFQYVRDWRFLNTDANVSVTLRMLFYLKEFKQIWIANNILQWPTTQYRPTVLHTLFSALKGNLISPDHIHISALAEHIKASRYTLTSTSTVTAEYKFQVLEHKCSGRLSLIHI